MTMTDSNNQYSGLRAYTAQKSQLAAEKAVCAINELIRNGDRITFDAVAKKAGIARSTIYCNQELCDRIKSLRDSPTTAQVECSKPSDAKRVNKLQMANQRLRDENALLIKQKEQLIAQLIEMEELKEENNRLKMKLTDRKS